MDDPDTYTIVVAFKRNRKDDADCILRGKPGKRPTHKEFMELFRRELQDAFDKSGMAGAFEIIGVSATPKELYLMWVSYDSGDVSMSAHPTLDDCFTNLESVIDDSKGIADGEKKPTLNILKRVISERGLFNLELVGDNYITIEKMPDEVVEHISDKWATAK